VVMAVPFQNQICGVRVLEPPLNASSWKSRSDNPLASKSYGMACWKLMVVVAAALRLFEGLPSSSFQVTVRVGFDPELVGSPLVESKVTVSSTDWYCARVSVPESVNVSVAAS